MCGEVILRLDLTVQEILDVSRPTVYALLKKKEFRWIQLDGGKYRISKKSFDDWLDKQPE